MAAGSSRGTRAPLLVFGPALFVLAVEGLSWVVAAITGSRGAAVAASYAFPIGILAGVAAAVLILARRQPGALTWSLVSVCLTVVGLGLGFLFWLGAATAGCGGANGCFG